MKRTVIDARVAVRRHGEGREIRRQAEALGQCGWAQGHGVAEEEGFADAGESGTRLARPGRNQRCRWAAEGKIEMLWVYGSDRSSRNGADFVLREEMGRRGVELVLLSDPPVPPLRLGAPTGSLAK